MSHHPTSTPTLRVAPPHSTSSYGTMRPNIEPDYIAAPGTENDEDLEALPKLTRPSPTRPQRRLHTAVIMGSVLASLLAVAALGYAAGRHFAAVTSPIKAAPIDGTPRRKRNLIMMVSDGFGPASETFGRTMYRVLRQNGTAADGHDLMLGPATPLDELLVGTSRTRSSSSWVTDSAAGATAFSCALKTYNGAIGVTPDQLPCATVFEAASLRGYKTGLAVTSRITHATPASFNAHVLWRDYENDIAEQQVGGVPVVGRAAHVMFGGGRRHYVPKSNPESVREDDLDLLAEARKQGMRVVTTRAEFDALAKTPDTSPVLGLFTPDHMSYEIDRDPAQEPSLAEMATRAIELLRAASEADPNSPGFFLMVEGSRIDMAAHSNDPGTHAHDILMYHDTVRALVQAIEPHGDTMIVSTSDHETGGLALARQLSAKYPEYLWKPDVVARQRRSTIATATRVQTMIRNGATKEAVRDVVQQWLGVTNVTPDELNAIMSNQTLTDLDYYLGNKIVSTRAELGWATHGHSAVDVNLYAWAPHHSLLRNLRGNRENTQVGTFLHEYLGITYDTILSLSRQLRDQFHFKHPNMPPPHEGPGLALISGDVHVKPPRDNHL